MGKLTTFAVRWSITAVAVWAATELVTGIRIEGPWWRYIVVAIVLGLVSASLGSLVKLFTFPLIILTLGLFLLVVNAITLAATAALLPWFTIDGFIPAFLGALIISVLSQVVERLARPLIRER